MLKTLIADDEPYTRKGLKALMRWRELGFEICGEAENGEQAFEKIKELKPDVIITDINMPLLNGLELIKKVNHEIKYDVKFIILSGYDEFDFARTAMRYGIKNYILKPIDEDELESVLKEVHDELKAVRESKEANIKAFNSISEKSLKLVLRSAVDRESVDNVKKILDIGDTGNFRYLMLEVENGNHVEGQQLKEDGKDNSHAVRHYLTEILGEEYKFNILEESYPNSATVNYGLIVTDKLLGNYKNDVSYFLEFIYSQLSEKIDKKIHIYVGKAVNKLLLLRESYYSAIFAHSIKAYINNIRIIYYDDIKSLPLNSEMNERLNFDDLIEAIENCDKLKINEVIDKEFEQEITFPIDLRMLAINVNFLIYRVVKLISKMNGETAEILRLSEIVSFNYFTAYNEIKDNIKSFSHNCAKYINNLKQNQSCGILSDVEKYIHKNYNRKITIKEVASRLFINPAYLGQIFKRKYGVSFNDYLHKYRIEKAKDLLKGTDLKIYEISEKLGYKNTDNFIEKFEEIIGTTPLQYRKSLYGTNINAGLMLY